MNGGEKGNIANWFSSALVWRKRHGTYFV